MLKDRLYPKQTSSGNWSIRDVNDGSTWLDNLTPAEAKAVLNGLRTNNTTKR